MSRISAARASLIGMHLVLFALVATVTVKFLSWPLTAAQWAFVVFASACVGLVFQQMRRFAATGVGGPSWQDDMRLVSLPILAVWLFQPYLTSQFFGGSDARSYGRGMMDALLQVRAGVFPVWVGQTEFMFEGVVHPIRTAPYHHYLGIVLDCLTWRSLDPVAVQHLTVIVTAITGAMVSYLSFAWLAPQQRGTAWAMTALYLSAPAAASYIYGGEMYMTFMAFAWLPLVLFANVRLIRQDDAIGWKFLVAGLALVWVCHPPVAIWPTIGTAVLQGLRLLLRDATLVAWKRAVGGVILFAGLSGYYFYSVGELIVAGEPSAPGPGANSLSAVLLAVGLVGFFRHVATGKMKWLLLSIMAAAALWFTFRGYCFWLGAATLVGVVWTRVTALWPSWNWRQRLPEISVGLVLVAGLSVLPWLPGADSVFPANLLNQWFPANLRPITSHANTLGDFQLGYALLGAWLLGVVSLFSTSRLEVRLPILVALVAMALVVPVPSLTRFLLYCVPEPVVAISSMSLWLRYLPTLVGLFALTGMLGAMACAARWPRSRHAITVLGCLALAWSLYQSQIFVRSGYRAIQSTGKHLDFHRPENATQFAYIFSWMPVSPYLVNGAADYHLESRLLPVDDPTQPAADTVPWNDVHWEKLVGTPDPGGANWLNLTPTLTLAPGEHRLLRFRFYDQPYNGVLIMRGPNGWYRQYQLPDAGFGPKSFGVNEDRPKTVAIWNSSSQSQPVELVFYRPEIPANEQPPVNFAEMAMLTYDPDKLPVRTLGLIPYRASATLTAPAFLETPRAFLPGYRATVNGRPALPERSPNRRVMIKLGAGENRVELRYGGTRWLWLTFAASGLMWCWLLVTGVRALYMRGPVGNTDVVHPA